MSNNSMIRQSPASQRPFSCFISDYTSLRPLAKDATRSEMRSCILAVSETKLKLQISLNSNSGLPKVSFLFSLSFLCFFRPLSIYPLPMVCWTTWKDTQGPLTFSFNWKITQWSRLSIFHSKFAEFPEGRVLLKVIRENQKYCEQPSRL